MGPRQAGTLLSVSNILDVYPPWSTEHTRPSPAVPRNLLEVTNIVKFLSSLALILANLTFTLSLFRASPEAPGDVSLN